MFPRAITEACMKRPAFVIGDRVIVKPGTENNPSLSFRLMSILRRGILTRTERETGVVALVNSKNNFNHLSHKGFSAYYCQAVV